MFSTLDFNCEFSHLAKDLLPLKRGGGYWCWKPFVVQNALRSTNAELMVYSDV